MEKLEIENILDSKYNMDIISIEKSDEATDGNVYIISNTDKKKYVIKVYDDLKHAESMVSIHKYINKLELNAPIIINNNDNNSVTEKENRYIVCYSFIEGVKLKSTELTKRRIEDIARYLRGVHSIKENLFNLKEVPYKVETDRQSLLHFDITKQNIFINQNNQDDNKDEEICFIDFDDARFGPSVCDVAIALTNLFISKANGLDMDGMNVFIDEYYKDNAELKEKERAIIKEAAISWLKSIIDNPNFDTSTRLGLENKLGIWENINF